MIDADEIITENFIKEVQNLDFSADGYFIKSDMFWENTKLKYGLKNNKLCMFNKSKFQHPVVDDLDIMGMGEMEGHYQPTPIGNAKIGQITSPIIHYDRKGDWHARHEKYIQWEVEMNRRNAWPKDPIAWREFLKSRLRISYLRPIAIFIYGYFVKAGFLDGRAGLNHIYQRAYYTYRIVRQTKKINDGARDDGQPSRPRHDYGDANHEDGEKAYKHSHSQQTKSSQSS
jgi:hypothetical protein